MTAVVSCSHALASKKKCNIRYTLGHIIEFFRPESLLRLVLHNLWVGRYVEFGPEMVHFCAVFMRSQRKIWRVFSAVLHKWVYLFVFRHPTRGLTWVYPTCMESYWIEDSKTTWFSTLGSFYSQLLPSKDKVSCFHDKYNLEDLTTILLSSLEIRTKLNGLWPRFSLTTYSYTMWEHPK